MLATDKKTFRVELELECYPTTTPVAGDWSIEKVLTAKVLMPHGRTACACTSAEIFRLQISKCCEIDPETKLVKE